MAILSIIITHHLESIDIMLPMFNSINLQQGINFDDINIILCDDTNKFFDYSVLNSFINIKNRITFINLPSSSTNMNRQHGINNCKSEYFMLCDCDDSLYDFFTIRHILNNINLYKDVDIFSYESFNSLHNVNLGCLWMSLWGKVYRKSFFEKNKIHLLDLTIFDDFSTAELFDCVKEKKIMEIHQPIYIYIPRTGSTSNSSDKTLENLVEDFVVGGVNTLKLLKDICTKNSDTLYFDIHNRLVVILTWVYWKLQEYENMMQSIDHCIPLRTKLESYMVNEIIQLFGKNCIDKEIIDGTIGRFINISTVGNVETFDNWLIRIFINKEVFNGQIKFNYNTP